MIFINLTIQSLKNGNTQIYVLVFALHPKQTKHFHFSLVLNMVQEVRLWKIEYQPNYNFTRNLQIKPITGLWTTQICWQNWIFIGQWYVKKSMTLVHMGT